MSGWGLRGWNPGRWSPFGRQGQPAVKVTDADYSYITAADLERDLAETRRTRPQKDTDVIVFRVNRVSHPVHVAAYAIDDGELTVGAARELAAKRLDVPSPRMIRMFFKGKTLADDSHCVRDYGIASHTASDILCVIGDPPRDESGSDSDDSLGGGGAASPSSPTGKKRRKQRKRRGKKSGRASGNEGSDSAPTTPLAEHLPMPAGAHPLHRSAAATPSSSNTPGVTPGASPGPQTPQQKLQALTDKLRSELVPLAQKYIDDPPPDKAKSDFEYKKLSETILAQVLLKTDAVETEGNEDARQMRKAVVREAQSWLNKLDEVHR